MSGPQEVEEEAPPLTELESLQLKCNELTDESLVSQYITFSIKFKFE